MKIFVKAWKVIVFAVALFFYGALSAKAEEGFDLFGMAARTGVFFLDRGNLDDVEVVQEKLYNHGYDVIVDGNNGPKTENAVRKLQFNTGQPITGILTYEQWLSLTAAPLPKTWGALSVSLDGKFGEAHNKSSRALAEQIALRRCQRYTKQQCTVVSIHDYGWVVAGWCRSGNRKAVVLGAAASAADSRNKAFSQADIAAVKLGLNPYNGKDCFQTVALHAMFGYEHTFTEREGFEVEHQADGLLVDVPK